jgi:hypothetical protein
MTTLLHLHARPETPIVCDMSSADDTPDERLGEYGQLFEHALLRRERRTDAAVFSFRADPDVIATVSDLARREAACCPFLDYLVEVVGDEVVWTITSTITGDERAAVDVTLDAFHALPDHAGADLAGLFGRFAERGVDVVEAPVGSARFERRD